MIVGGVFQQNFARGDGSISQSGKSIDQAKLPGLKLWCSRRWRCKL